MYVGTKVRLRPEDLGDIRGAVIRSCEESLRRLGLPSVDLLQFHNPIALAHAGSSVAARAVIEDVVPAFEALKRQGKIKFFGKGWEIPTQERPPEYWLQMEMDKTVESIDATAEHTVVFKLKRVEAPFIVNLGMDKYSSRLLDNPEIITRGFVSGDEAETLIPAVRQRVVDVIHNGGLDMQKDIVDVVRTFIFNETRRKPKVFLTLTKV